MVEYMPTRHLTEPLKHDPFSLDDEGLLAGPLGPENIQDHEKAISVYFSDPFGNLLEVTTYDHAKVRKELQ